jgi:hypothetical protein
MAAHSDISNKDLESLISKIPKFNGALNAGDTTETRREHYVRWRNGIIKVLNLRGYGELIPQEDLLEVIPDGVEGAYEEEGAEEGGEERGETEDAGETLAARNRRLRRMQAPALAIVSLSLQAPVSDWVDYMIAGKNDFHEIWISMKALYGVSSETDKMSVLEAFATLRLNGHEDPVKFYMKLLSFSTQMTACGNSSLGTPARRILAFMTKIPKTPGGTWEDFRPTTDQKRPKPKPSSRPSRSTLISRYNLSSWASPREGK